MRLLNFIPGGAVLLVCIASTSALGQGGNDTIDFSPYRIHSRVKSLNLDSNMFRRVLNQQFSSLASDADNHTSKPGNINHTVKIIGTVTTVRDHEG